MIRRLAHFADSAEDQQITEIITQVNALFTQFSTLSSTVGTMQSVIDGLKTAVNALILGGSFPTGFGPVPWPTDTPPEGWLLCYGQAISRTDYALLFTVIGTTFGSGDGSTTFNLPDLRGRTLIGLDNMGGTSADIVTNSNADTLGGTDGKENHTLSIAQIGKHNHLMPMGFDSNHNIYCWGDSNGDPVSGSQVESNVNGHYTNTQYTSPIRMAYTFSQNITTSSTAHNNMQPWLALNSIIKY